MRPECPRRKLKPAVRELESALANPGDIEWASPSPDYERVVDKYAKAVEAAVRAMGECS